MKNIIKIGLIAGAAWLAYKMLHKNNPTGLLRITDVVITKAGEDLFTLTITYDSGRTEERTVSRKEALDIVSYAQDSGATIKEVQ